jgi:hypothetical protein
MDCFKVISQNIHGGTETKHEKPIEWPVTRRIFESETSRIWAQSFRYTNLSATDIFQIYMLVAVFSTTQIKSLEQGFLRS